MLNKIVDYLSCFVFIFVFIFAFVFCFFALHYLEKADIFGYVLVLSHSIYFHL
jgi:hypothetical protein